MYRYVTAFLQVIGKCYGYGLLSYSFLERVDVTSCELFLLELQFNEWVEVTYSICVVGCGLKNVCFQHKALNQLCDVLENLILVCFVLWETGLLFTFFRLSIRPIFVSLLINNSRSGRI